jgi:formylglycine-generating enzyme
MSASFFRSMAAAGFGLVPALALGSACGGPREPALPEPAPPPTSAPATPDAAAASDAAAPDAEQGDAAQASSAGAECPPDMAHVQKDFCTEIDRQCKKSEYDKVNRLTICHRFAEGSTRCKGRRIALDFCIDRYEYPNKKGARPPVMVDWYDAMGKCAAEGKRLCYESEWTAACEGPDETPFPYGWERSAQKCNIDNRWIDPSLKQIYSKDPAVRQAELDRLDQSVPSGSKAGCVSGYGVYDLTGNFDGWTLADRDRPEEKAVFAALKGGAWGRVRNACRPVTTSHEPEFTYYFVSFRCCKDPASMPAFEGRPRSK